MTKRLTTKNLFCTILVSLTMGLSSQGSAIAQELNRTISSWEKHLNARIGVLLREMESDWSIAHRADERFPMSSTFKSLLCGAVLARVDANEENLSNKITFTRKDLVSYSPVTKKRVKDGMSVSELCEATITISDNTAANLLLKRIDGPKGLTKFLRKMGDTTTRLDRWETELNEGKPGDAHDTTTPRAILGSLEKLAFGNVLKQKSSQQLRQWMIDDKVADALIRAHLPKGWTIGDKTGAGGYGTRGIIAFIERPDGKRYLGAIYMTENKADFPMRNKVISDIGRTMITEIQAR